MSNQQTLFPVKLPKKPEDRYMMSLRAYGKKFTPGLSKVRRPGKLLETQTNACYYLGIGEPYGILCRRYEGWYIKAIMAFIKQSGINAYYEKIHEKGLGFTGYIIKLKNS